MKSLLETMPWRSQNIWGVLNSSEAEIRSAARRRVRKSRGEQAMAADSNSASRSVFVVGKQQVLRFAQDDNLYVVDNLYFG